MNPEHKEILWKSYRAFRQYKRLSTILSIILMITSAACALANRPDISIISGGIAFLAYFHAVICNQNAVNLRREVFNPYNREQ
jgi:hypothetical protein